MEQPVTIRVARSTFVVFAILFSPLLLWSVALLWGTTRVAEGCAVSLAYVLALFWACSRAFELSPGRLVYRSLFRRETIDLNSVSDVSIHARPAPSLELHCSGRSGRATTFLIKPFSRNGLVAVLQHIRAANPDIRFDAISDDMSRADFRSVTREALATTNLLRIALMAGAIAFGGILIKLLRG
jgi:hypothetical protein